MVLLYQAAKNQGAHAVAENSQLVTTPAGLDIIADDIVEDGIIFAKEGLEITL